MKSTIDVLELLTEQHTEVDELVAKIESGKGDKHALFVELADKLAAHAAIEEKIFYPAAMSSSTADTLKESVEEHLQIKRILADMLTLDCDSEEFAAKLSVLKEDLEHHAHEEEEKKMFPKLRRMMSADLRAGLGNECLAMFEELVAKEPRRDVPAETAQAASLPSP